MTYKIGMVVDGVITGIQPYGAFVSLDQKKQGLVHISEVKSGYIKNIKEVLSVGKEVSVKIIDIDEYSKKISLSLRALEPYPSGNSFKRKRFFTNPKNKIGFNALDTAMPKWIDQAIENLTNNG